MIIKFIGAFLILGTFCLIAQVILDHSKLTPGHITSLFVVLGSFLEFVSIYSLIRKIGFIGASLPISSFGATIMKSVKDAIDNEGFIGIFKGIFDKTGALIAFAIFISFIASIIFKPKS